MIIDLYPTQNGPSGSGKDGSQQGNVALINGVIEAGKAMVSYEAACTMLMELVPIVADNKEELALLLRGKEELRSFFEKRNTPQPSAIYEGCNVFMGETQGDKFVGKEDNNNVNCPGNQIINQQTNNNIKDK